MKNLNYLLVSTLILAACSSEKKNIEEIEKSQNLNAANVNSEILIQVSNDSQLESIKNKYTNLSIQTVDADLGIYQISSALFSGKEHSIAKDLESKGDVNAAEVNYLWDASDIQANNLQTKEIVARDPRWLSLWGLKNYGQDAPGGSEGKPDADIGASLAWTKTTGSKKIIVAVIDSGIDYTHPDLAQNMWINEAEKSGLAGVDDDGNGWTDDVYGWNFVSLAESAPYHGQLGNPDPMDDNGHGTHCAGTIGASGNNFIGVAGVNWNVSLMALKFLSSSGSGDTSDLLRALRYAQKNNVDVINASFGGGGKSKFIEAMIESLEESGTLFVAAAGNSATDNDVEPHFPSSYEAENILSVAATDNRDQMAVFSCYGQDSVDIAAPGVGILSTYPLALAAKEGMTSPYAGMSGTSMATPHVVGAAALILAAKPELLKKPVELKKFMMKNAQWLPQLSGKMQSGARLDLAIALGLRSNSRAVALPASEENGWIVEDLTLQTPMNPTRKINDAFEIKKEGVVALQAHVKQGVIDPIDSLSIFDGLYRPMGKLSGLIWDYWTPVVSGDKLLIKFSNAMVSVQKYLGTQVVKDPSELELEEGQSYSICMGGRADGKMECHIMDKATDPMANFASEGIEIDKIRYFPTSTVTLGDDHE